METANVKIFEFKGWYSTFLVDETVRVKTVDIYTYKCAECVNCFECRHVKDVEKFVSDFNAAAKKTSTKK